MLKTWITENIHEPTAATRVARLYLRATDQPSDPALITRTIVEMFDLGLLDGAPNKLGTMVKA